MQYKLSICIPTYNRAQYLTVLLDSVLEQINAKYPIEICISDNCSIDNTEMVVSEFKHKYQHVVFFRWSQNMGFDKNILKTVEIANGEFCWLMGDDDRLENNAINSVIQALESTDNLSGLTVNQNIYSNDMRELFLIPSPADHLLKNYLLFRDIDSAFSKLGCYFGYISGQIVRKKLWDQVVAAEDMRKYFNGYIHLFMIGKILQISPIWLYVCKKLVGTRTGNDTQLAQNGIISRMKLDIDGYTSIAKYLFTQSKTYKNLISNVLNIYIRDKVLSAKLEGKGFEAFQLIIGNFWNFPVFWTKLFPIFLIPRSLLLTARYFYRLCPKKFSVKKV